MPSVYLETSIVSYLAARTSRDLITAGRQQVTREWWNTRRHRFSLFASEVVVDEAARGDPTAATRRLFQLAGVPLFKVTDDADVLASSLQLVAALPQKAVADALHVALATVNGMDYLLTWNLSHIANARQRPSIERACNAAGYKAPVICTPDELMGGI